MTPKTIANYRMSGGKQETFLYFAYGSNMLTQRIRINNPSARFLAALVLVALHFTPVNSSLAQTEFRTSIVSRLASLFQKNVMMRIMKNRRI